MSGAHRSTSRGHRSNRKNGAHRVATKPSRQPYNWLGVGAVTLGLGAAMASGTGIANAKGGSDSSNNSTSSSADHSSSPGHSTGSSGKGRKHTKKSSDTGTSGAATSATATGDSSPSGTDSTAADADSASGGHDATAAGRHAAKARKSKTDATDQGTAKAKAKAKKQATTADGSGSSSGTDSAGTGAAAGAGAVAAAAAPATATKTTAKAVALSATSASATSVASSDTTTTTTTTTTAHATSSNPIVAAIQNAVISFFTSAETIAQLAANGLTGPTAPSSVLNPVGAFLYGIFRGIEDFAGLVPHVGTPTTTSDPVTGTATGNLNFTSPAGAEMTYTVSTNPLFGSVTVNTDGSYSYKSNIFGAALAALGLNPTDKFTVTASTGVASTNVTVTVPVTAANDTPSTPVSAGQHVDASTGVVTGTLSSTAPDGQPVTYSVLTPTVQGSLTVDSNGNFTYTPSTLARIAAIATSLTGLNVDAFTVLATSANGSVSLPGIITVPIEPATNATPSTPTATNVVANTVTGVVTGTITATDPNGQALSYTVLTGTLLGNVSVNSTTGAFTYTPSAAARVAANPILGVSVVNTDAFTVTASNGSYSSTAIITVPIEPANGNTPSTPSATNVVANTVTGVVTGTITATDPGGQALSYTVLTGTLLGNVSVNSTTGAFTYTPSAAARTAANPILGVSVVNTDAFTVTASNGSYSSTAIITVPIEPAANNTPTTPGATNLSTNTTTGVVTGTFTSTSPDGSALTYTLLHLPTQGSITVSGNTFTYTPSTLAQLEASLGLTTDTFGVIATNTAGISSSLGMVTVTVAPIANVLDFPSSPTAGNQNANSISGVVTGTVSATDPAGAGLTYHVLTGPAFGTLTLDPTTGNYTYTPSNAARTAANPILGVSVVNTDGFTVYATNGTYSSVVPTLVTVPIAPAVNDTPSAITATKNQNIYSGVVTGTLTATSPDGSTITYSVTPNLLGNNTTTNSSLTLSTANGVTTYTYTPTLSARNNAESILNGGLGITSDSFTITATNTAGLSNSTTISVPISPASNDTPSAPTATKNQNIYSGVVTGTLSSTSPDGSTITYSVTPNLLGNNTTTNSSLTLTTNNGVTTYTYTPTTSARNNANAILSGGLGITSDSFTITATNTAGFSSSSTISVPISPASNDTPSSVNATQNQNLATGVVTGTLTATSPDGSAITYTVSPNLLGNNTTTNSGLTLTTNNGITTYTYTPTPSARVNAQPLLSGGLGVSSDSFTITATNTAGFSNSTTITVPISPSSNDTPSGSHTATSGSHKTTGTVTGTSPDGTVITYSASTIGGSVSINPTTGAYTFTDGYVGIYPLGVYVGGIVTFTVTNTSGFSNSWTVTFGA